MKVLVRVKERDLSGSSALLATLAGAALTAACAQIGFYLPHNPVVPVTLQVFAVILCGMVLGPRLGAIAQIEYLVAGAAGAPVFSCFRGGWLMLAGPTGGYLVGFVAMAFVTGMLASHARSREESRRASGATDAGDARKHGFAMLSLAGLAGVVTLYVFGTTWLVVWLGDTSGLRAWLLGAVPFALIDTAKVAAASALACRGESLRRLL